MLRRLSYAGAALVAVFIIVYWAASSARCGGPQAVCEVLAQEADYWAKARSGDVDAAIELSTAYADMEERQKSEDALRTVAGKGNVRVDALLGRILMQQLSDVVREGGIPDRGKEAEMYRLLRSSAARGDRASQRYLDMYERAKQEHGVR